MMQQKTSLISSHTARRKALSSPRWQQISKRDFLPIPQRSGALALTKRESWLLSKILGLVLLEAIFCLRDALLLMRTILACLYERQKMRTCSRSCSGGRHERTWSNTRITLFNLSAIENLPKHSIKNITTGSSFGNAIFAFKLSLP